MYYLHIHTHTNCAYASGLWQEIPATRRGAKADAGSPWERGTRTFQCFVGIEGSSGESYAGQLVIGLKHLKALFGVGASVEVISDAGWTSSMC